MLIKVYMTSMNFDVFYICPSIGTKSWKIAGKKFNLEFRYLHTVSRTLIKLRFSLYALLVYCITCGNTDHGSYVVHKTYECFEWPEASVETLSGSTTKMIYIIQNYSWSNLRRTYCECKLKVLLLSECLILTRLLQDAL